TFAMYTELHRRIDSIWEETTNQRHTMNPCSIFESRKPFASLLLSLPSLALSFFTLAN
ncbi:hypothetical protein BT69DRAFT_1286643, partial [Atractiella rhizophila]